MKIYIASYFNTKERLLPMRDALRKMGHEVVSTWLDEPPNPTATIQSYTEQQLEGWAVRDVDEIDDADLLIIDTLDVTDRGGREVEFGFALAQHKLTVRVGPIRNVFHYLVDISFDSWDKCLMTLEKLNLVQ